MSCSTLDKKDVRWTVAVMHGERNHGPSIQGFHPALRKVAVRYEVRQILDWWLLSCMPIDLKPRRRSGAKTRRQGIKGI